MVTTVTIQHDHAAPHRERVGASYDDAVLHSLPLYTGKACHRCGSKLRRTKKRACVECRRRQRAKEQAAQPSATPSATMVRVAAWMRGERRYSGTQCSRCGGTERFSSSGSCVACQRSWNKRYNERRTESA